jgi:vitamin-K-epoxide reductase (warfarin-sensitive)
MFIPLIIFSCIGFSISLYAYIIEQKIRSTPDYKPFCDINDRISCSKPLKSEYSNLFFFSNAIVGMVFYALTIVLAILGAKTALLVAALGCIMVTCVLAYILYAKIKSFCLVCTSTYIVNIIIFLLAIRNFYL